MRKVILLTANVILDSLRKLEPLLDDEEDIIVLSTNRMFLNERNIIEKYINVLSYETFAENLTDEEMEACDKRAYHDIQNEIPLIYEYLPSYYALTKKYKNEIVRDNIIKKYGSIQMFILANDLGIDLDVWMDENAQKYTLEYYYSEEAPAAHSGIVDKFKEVLKKNPFLVRMVHYFRPQLTHDIFEAEYCGKKYIFIGSLNKVGYRMQLEWKRSTKEYKRIARGKYYNRDECQYLSTLHERFNCTIPDSPSYDVRYIQDGYLPPNYSSLYLKFKNDNVKYYAWDSLGTRIFHYQNVPVDIMPFRKKLYLPQPVFAKEIKKILIVTSGAGDWIALKNRSDEDLMVEAFGIIAKHFKDIEFVYRCHPVWVHPQHQGINSINRVAEYFETLGLKNLKVSTNIIKEDLKSFKVSLPRQSMDEDLKDTDLIFGEHSIAMVDGALKGIPFASVNLTGRRDLFEGLTDLGFPHFEKVDDVISFIEHISSDTMLQNKYMAAVNNYNVMTDIE